MQYNIEESERLFQQKYIHQQKTVENLVWYNTLLLVVYYGCIIVAIYTLVTKYDYSMYAKIIISIFAISYPFIISFIENFIYTSLQFIAAILTGEIAK